jgi:hypothetical protein
VAGQPSCNRQRLHLKRFEVYDKHIAPLRLLADNVQKRSMRSHVANKLSDAHENCSASLRSSCGKQASVTGETGVTWHAKGENTAEPFPAIVHAGL